MKSLLCKVLLVVYLLPAVSFGQATTTKIKRVEQPSCRRF